MLIAKDIQRLFGQLNLHEDARITIDGSDVRIQFEESDGHLSLKTIVYNGGNYIPSSVRRCLSLKSPFHMSINAYLTLNEPDFLIELNYKDKFSEPLSYRHFKDLLEEFGMIAEQWRAHLDEHDRNDLVYVRVK